MSTNDIKLFAGDAAALVLDQADYVSDAQRIIGNQPGVARADFVNKALRQASFVAAAVAQYVVNQAGVDVLDDADVPGLAAKILTAIETSLSVTYASNAEAQALASTTKAISPSTLNYALKGANQLMSANGYQILPGGLIMQWGVTGFVEPPNSFSVSFPITFPNNCRGVFTGPSTTAGTFINTIAFTASGFTAYADEYTAIVNGGVIHWFAIGY